MEQLSEKEEIYERKSFWKWLAITSLIFSILFGLGFCEPIYHAKHKIPNYIKQNDKSGYIPNDQNGEDPYGKSQDLIGKEKKTSAYKLQLPSNKYLVVRPITLSQLAQKWHCNVDEIYNQNPWLQDEPKNDPIKPSQPIEVPESSNLEGWEKEVFDLTNAERVKAGLPKFKDTYAQLNKSSTAKAQDMNKNNYFSHNSPTYGSPFDMMKQFDVTFNYAAENIAQGQRTPKEVVEAWMNSSGHRANILNKNLNYLGVGFEKGQDKFYWVQQFVGK